MLKSMTGYGKGESSAVNGNFTVEIRSVNHRYSEISVRMPRGFLTNEHEVKRAVSSTLKRGKCDVFVQWDDTPGVTFLPEINMALARGYSDAFKSVAKELGLAQDISAALILSQKGVIRDSEGKVDEDDVRHHLISAVESAVRSINNMRVTEGMALAADLAERRTQVAEWVALIKERVPSVVIEYRQKLRQRLDQLLEGNELDETRLAQEIAIMADRCDVTEELVRLASHFKQFDESLKTPEPVGRKLDFLMQEMNREINTIGSKSNDAEITSLVVRIKAEMEKMREQVQNVE